MKVYVASERVEPINLPEPKTLAEHAQNMEPVKFVWTLLAAKRALTVEYLEEAWLMPYPFAIDALTQQGANRQCILYDTEREDDVRELKNWMNRNRDRFNLASPDPIEHFRSRFPEEVNP